jgi:nicotinate-nucleotide pyrophosphorylase (carboxylating)
VARRASAPRADARSVAQFARRAVEEDRYRADRTTRAVLPHAVAADGRVEAQAVGVLSGIHVARAVARVVGVRVVAASRDGARVRPGSVVLRLRGDARKILGAERTILNVLMHASGVATATDRAVRAARGGVPRLEVWGTRKTTPGLRDLEKAAIVHGGGRPHRRDLSDAVLIKNNHLAFVPLVDAVRAARSHTPRHVPVEVEVASAAEAIGAVRAGASMILIDNANPARARSIVRALEEARLRSRVWVELSGSITPENVRSYRRVGANAASLGSITHSAAGLPFHLVLKPARLSPRRT